MLNSIYKIRNISFMLYLMTYVLVLPFTFTYFVNSLIWHIATVILLVVVLANNTFNQMAVKENLLFNISFIVVMIMNLLILGRFLFDSSLRVGNLNIWSLNESYLNMNYALCALLIFGIIILNALVLLKDKVTH